jgi:hypothetical protein
MKVALVYPPFCPPTVPPYSITYLESFLTANSDAEVKCLDLNARFHRMKFAGLYKTLEKSRADLASYSELLEKLSSKSRKVQRENNSMADTPELFGELLGAILAEKPDAVGFSLVYNSQQRYAAALAAELAKRGIDCVAGGPAAGKEMRGKMRVLKNEAELLKHLTGKDDIAESYALDFSEYPPGDYLSKEMIYPVRSSYGCCYGACAFCNHHGNVPYREIPLRELRKTILDNNIRNLFFIDDTIPAKRLAALAEMLGPLKVRWWCQTRPTRDLFGLFGKLRAGGLAAITFGVESANQGVLDSMGKGTRPDDISKVLAESHAAGVRNIVFVMFGFPGETEPAFADTMEFLRDNRENIDIVSSSLFGLQKGSRVYADPARYGVASISEHEAPLGEVIRYEVARGLGEKEAKALKESVEKELRSMNRLPKIFALYKEQTVLF